MHLLFWLIIFLDSVNVQKVLLKIDHGWYLREVFFDYSSYFIFSKE